MEDPQPGDALFVEFYRINNEDKVSVLYKKEGNSQEVILFDSLKVKEF